MGELEDPAFILSLDFEVLTDDLVGHLLSSQGVFLVATGNHV